MAQEVVVLFVHGIQADRINYAEPMRDALIKRLGKLASHVAFAPVFWADIVRPHQENYMQRAHARAGIADSKLRRFFVQGLGDAAAYQKTRSRQNSSYYRIQGRIVERLLGVDSPARRSAPLVFIGHSLGCHIISSFAWDNNWLKQKTEAEAAAEEDTELFDWWRRLQGASPLCRLDTFAGFVTMGSNMPLFTFTFGPERVYPITHVRPDLQREGSPYSAAFPGAALSGTPLAEKARWLNFYSKSDMLGYPLKPLNPAYENEDRLVDIEVRTEKGGLSGLNPITRFESAHSGYWTNATVVRQTAGLIQELAEAPRL